MDCQECYELLPLYIDQSISPEEIESICTHVALCPQCKQEFELLTATHTLVKNLECVEAPADFHERFQKRFNQECRPGFRWGFWGIFSFGSVAAAAAALLIVVLNNPFTAPKKSPAHHNEVSTNTITNPAQEKQTVASVPASKNPNIKTELNVFSNDRSTVRRENQLNEASAMNVGYTAGETALHRQPTYRMAAVPQNTQPELVRQRGEWSGDHCALHQALNQVARTPEELAKFWENAEIKSITMPQIDWSKKMVGIICLGDRQGRGYEIMLKEIEKQEKNLDIKFQVNEQNIIRDGNITQPFIIFTLPKSGHQVIFNQER